MITEGAKGKSLASRGFSGPGGAGGEPARHLARNRAICKHLIHAGFPPYPS